MLLPQKATQAGLPARFPDLRNKKELDDYLDDGCSKDLRAPPIDAEVSRASPAAPLVLLAGIYASSI